MSDVDREAESALAGLADTPAESPSDVTEPPDAARTPPIVSFTLTEAAERCRVHRATIRRKLDDGAFPNAWREDDGGGPWRIPLGDLLVAGLELSPLGSGPPDIDRTDERDTDEQAELSRLHREIGDLRTALQHERDAHSRTQDLFEQTLRALSPAPVQPQSQPPVEPVASPRRRWWQR